ncbi:YwpF-like family protein [Halalkalibacterium ligniniphilum]|uniref:YwpF-like family protein n=1 Tax=Halalkalibacterium ligniniphilum TaxID=1134413 RepID=UPI0003695FBB|nr:YwpF-like family protein [Halalkalibacterium ligniniphilum]
MKTFKLYSLQIWKEQKGELEKKRIPTKDGLIINMENSKGTWLIDAVVAIEQLPLFQQVKKEDKDLLVEVVITSPNNYPATMIVHVRRVTELSDQISVLLEGSLLIQKEDIVEHMLKQLVEEGYTGERLLQEFKQRKDQQRTSIEVVANELYLSMKESGQYRL